MLRQLSNQKWELPIPVISAFGGLGIYRLADALTSNYVGKTSQGEDICEHVSFSTAMTANSRRLLYIFPRLRNWAPLEHQKPIEVVVRKMRIEQNSSQCEIWAPHEHPLDVYRQSHPLYDHRLPLLAQLVQEENHEGCIIDIGANIGDTIALLRLAGVQAPIVALEPSPRFFTVLKSNIATQPSFFGQVQALNAFAGDPTHSLRLEERTGTASTQQIQPERTAGVHIQAPTIPLYYLGLQDISIVKIDTDGYDASILQSEFSYLTRTLPIVWTEAEIRSMKQHADWDNLLKDMLSVFEWVCVFDNFGFLVTHGRLNIKATTILDLLKYTHHHASLPVESFGEPRIYYLDLVFFPSRWQKVYSGFIGKLPEA